MQEDFSHLDSKTTEFLLSRLDELEDTITSQDSQQMALKILANAGYGAITNQGFRYFEIAIGEAITLTGQISDIHVEMSLNAAMNEALGTNKTDYVIAADTDSVYLNTDPLVKKFCPQNSTIEYITKFLSDVGTRFQDTAIKSSTTRFFNMFNCREYLMRAKREAIFSMGIFVKKKKYALKVHNSEGVNFFPYKLKIMGLETARSSTPKIVRDALKKCIELIFDTNDEAAIHKKVSEFRNTFFGSRPEEIASPRSVNDMGAYYVPKGSEFKKATPIHVKASMVFNYNCAKSPADYIENSDRIKYVYMREPNPLHSYVFAWPADIPFPDAEKLEKYIDYELQFEKTFISPLENILSVIGWHHKKRASLVGLFE